MKETRKPSRIPHDMTIKSDILPHGRKFRRSPVLLSVSSGTYSTQSDPMHYVRISRQGIEMVLDQMCLPWRWVLDRDETGPSSIDWRGWHCPGFRTFEGHYEVKLSTKVSWEDFVNAFFDAEVEVYTRKFKQEWTRRPDADCWLEMARNADKKS